MRALCIQRGNRLPAQPVSLHIRYVPQAGFILVFPIVICISFRFVTQPQLLPELDAFEAFDAFDALDAFLPQFEVLFPQSEALF